MSTLEGYDDTCRECSAHRRVTMMHVEGYYEHIGIFNISQRL